MEKELVARQVRGLDISRIECREGGLLFSKREYLRLRWERLVFDVCAVPFGTAYLFSCWFVEIPSVVNLWEALVLPLGFCLVFGLCLKVSGFLMLVSRPVDRGADAGPNTPGEPR